MQIRDSDSVFVVNSMGLFVVKIVLLRRVSVKSSRGHDHGR